MTKGSEVRKLAIKTAHDALDTMELNPQTPEDRRKNRRVSEIVCELLRLANCKLKSEQEKGNAD